MGLGRLILRELLHRKLNFALGAVSAALAIGCLAAALAFLREHTLRTNRILADKELETHKKLEAFEDDIRKITVRMGFNILIMPKDQNLGDFYAADHVEKFMPEEYAERLIKSRVAIINHVLPSLQMKVKWPEKERTVFVMGVCGELALHSEKQKPIQGGVRPGEVLLGHELHRSLNLQPGASITFLGKVLKVVECRPEKGNKDDITLWMNLAEAQKLLNKSGLINAILALECNCASIDRLGDIRAEIAKILPDTQVIEYASQALARAEARNRAAAEAAEALERERAARARLGREKEELAAIVLPLVLCGCAIWIGFIAWNNVRERRMEIGILRALGISSLQVILLFLGRAIIMGLAGAVAGMAAGFAFAYNWMPEQTMRATIVAMLAPAWIIGAVIVAPFLAAVASWIPALLASQQDPADILREG